MLEEGWDLGAGGYLGEESGLLHGNKDCEYKEPPTPTLVPHPSPVLYLLLQTGIQSLALAWHHRVLTRNR